MSTVDDNSLEKFTFSIDPSVSIPKKVQQLTIFLNCVLENSDPSRFILPANLCKELRCLLQVTLPDGLKELSKSAFAGCISLCHVGIPNTVEIIGDECFQDCKSLCEIELPNGLQTLDKYAFCRCVSLARIKVPSGVQVVGEGCFYLCKALVELTLEEGVCEIQRAAIYHCNSLEGIQFPSTLQVIGKSALSVCTSLVHLHFPHGMRLLGDDGCRACPSLERVTMPPTIESIGAFGPFRQCPRLKHVVLSEGLRVIPKCAFWECHALSTIKIPSSVETIEYKAFKDCRSLVEVEFLDGLQVIGQQAFFNCVSLSAVSLPPSLYRLELGAFEHCTSLVTVEFPPRAPQVIIALDVFRGCASLLNVLLPLSHRRYNTHISALWFAGCTLIQNVLGSYHEVDGLKRRFQIFPIHRLCYFCTTTTVEELEEAFNHPYEVVDWFQTTPFHVLLSSVKPRMDLLEVLFEKILNWHPLSILGVKDRNGKRALDYLIPKWNKETNKEMFSVYLQKWMMDRLFRWGSIRSQMELQNRFESILEEEDYETRDGTLQEMYVQFERCEFDAGVSYLELGVWKMELIERRKGVKRIALDRETSRIQCGSSCIIPNVVGFLV